MHDGAGEEVLGDVARRFDVVMTASALLRHGPEHATILTDA